MARKRPSNNNGLRALAEELNRNPRSTLAVELLKARLQPPEPSAERRKLIKEITDEASLAALLTMKLNALKMPHPRIMLLNHQFAGQLWRLRQCERCGKWYVARRRVGRWCPGNCRKLAYQATPQGKAAHARASKRYYDRWLKAEPREVRKKHRTVEDDDF